MTQAADAIRDARSVAVLTGAGISVDSGLPTFRGDGGLWRGRDPMRLATPEAFAAEPGLVWEFYNERRRRAFAAEPNAGHRALVELARRRPTTLITQNVDRLHRRAGSEGVIELHGNLEDVRCTGCGETSHRPGEALPDLPECEGCGGRLRPAVVWFGEALPAEAIERAAEAAARAELFLSVGTSSVVYPAAGLIDVASLAGATVIEVNPEPSGADVDIQLAGTSAEVLPMLVAGL